MTLGTATVGAGVAGGAGVAEGVATGVGVVTGAGVGDGATCRTAPSATVPATIARAMAKVPAATMLPVFRRVEDIEEILSITGCV